MSFLSKLFGGKPQPTTATAANEKPIQSYANFWGWFVEHQDRFHAIVRAMDSSKIEKDFFGAMRPQLDQIKDGINFLVGMLGDGTVDMIFTADGDPKTIAFVEDLVDAAPHISGWVFKSSKPAVEGFGISMGGVEVDANSLSFYSNDDPERPDLVNITIVHEAFGGSSDTQARKAGFIFLDNFLGELNFLINIDDLEFRSPTDAEKDLIPIEALPNYLETRQALFVEKYHGVRIFTDSDNYSLMEGKTADGRPLVATINTDLMKWDKKASHPWMLIVTLPYRGRPENGMPDAAIGTKMYEIEDAFSAELKDADGYLNIVRYTAENARRIFFACADFREPSKVAYQLQRRYSGSFAIEYDIFKDKYWQSISHFAPQ